MINSVIEIKLFATDIDGTLLNDKEIISSYNLNAMYHLHDSCAIIMVAIDNTMKAVKEKADYSTNNSKI